MSKTKKITMKLTVDGPDELSITPLELENAISQLSIMHAQMLKDRTTVLVPQTDDNRIVCLAIYFLGEEFAAAMSEGEPH